MPSKDCMLGHSPEEVRRLARQAALAAPETAALFRCAGITAGMRVLDIGSGAGDVAMLAGFLVQPNGSVLGIERSADAVALATSRAQAAGSLAVRSRWAIPTASGRQAATMPWSGDFCCRVWPIFSARPFDWRRTSARSA